MKDLTLESLLVLSCIILVFATWMVCHFASRKTSYLTQMVVIISLALGFAGVVLLPIDLTVTTVFEEGSEEAENREPNETYLAWLITYWSTFLLAWVILPLIRESLVSGQFTPMTRLKAGCRVAVQGYVLLLVVAIISIIILAWKLKSWHVVPVLMALGNTYGLLLVALLLGYGLVDFPEKLWRQADPQTELRRTRIIASNADESLFEAVWELQDCEALIDRAAERIGDYEEDGSRFLPQNQHYASCVDKLLTSRKSTAILSPELQRRRTAGHRRLGEDRNDDSGNESEGLPSLNYLAQLNCRLEHAQAEVISAEQRWNSIVAKSKFYAELAENNVSRPVQLHDVRPQDSMLKKFVALFIFISSNIRYLWLTSLRKPVYKVLAMSSAALSIMVLWSEATLASPYNLSPFALLLRIFDGEERGILFQLAALVPFAYMSICMYGSLFKLSLFGRYRLRGQKMSHGVALVFNAQYLVRLQFPLGYNYLFMIKYDTSTTNCAFSHVMSNMATVPFFGTSFSVYAPLLILALCGFTLCRGYPRLLAALGVEHEDAILLGDQETLDTKVNEGITLLRRSTSRETSSPSFRRQDTGSETELV